MRWDPRHWRTALKLAVFAVICLILLAVLAEKLGHLSFFSHRTGYEAQLADVTGLTTGNAVKIAGVTVGRVTSIRVQRGHALVGFTVTTGVRVPRSTRVGLEWHNALGQQYLYLYPGTHGPSMPAGSTIPLSHDVSSASVGKLLSSLGPFLAAINPQQANAFIEAIAAALQGNASKVNDLLNSSASLAQALGSMNAQVGAVIDNFDQVLTALAARDSSISGVIANLSTLSASLASRNSLLDGVVANLSKAAGELAALEVANRSNLNGAATNLEVVASTLARHQAALGKDLGTLGEGLAPYTEISSWGQWFQIQTVYTCLADEVSCSYYQATNAPSSGGGGYASSANASIAGLMQQIAGGAVTRSAPAASVRRGAPATGARG